MRFIVYREIVYNPTHDFKFESASQDSKIFSKLYDANKYFMSIRDSWRKSFDIQNDLQPQLQKFRKFRQENKNSGEVKFYCKLIGSEINCGIIIEH